MINKDIYILGVGNNTGVYIDLAQSCGYRVAGLYHFNDERTGELYLNIPIIGSNINLFRKNNLYDMKFAVSVGDNNIRADLSNHIRNKGGNCMSLFHPSSIVSKYAHIAKGVIINANSVVQAGVLIDEDTVVSNNVSITHNSIIGKACYIANSSSVGAYVRMFDKVLIGQGATIISGKVKEIGENSVIGAGSVVTKSIKANSIVVGIPAKVIKKLDDYGI